MSILSKSKSDSKILNLSEVAITNSLSDSKILPKVEKFGYNASKLNEGKQLLEVALEKYKENLKLDGHLQNLTQSMREKFETGKQAYQDLAKVVRAIFKNDKGILAQLGIEGKMPRTIAGFIASALTLFDNASKVEEVRAKLSEYGYDDTKLKTEKLKILELQDVNNQQEAAKGSAQNSTREKDKAIKTLYEWVMQYIKIARVALKDDKDLLESIGVRVYSRKTQKQIQAPKKAAATRKNKRSGS
jgi:hypothetical protein